MNWRDIARRDEELRGRVDRAGEALAKFRYAQTIAAGVALREYARRTGAGYTNVRNYAKAWEAVLDGDQRPFPEVLARVGAGADRADVNEAIARARGTGSGAVTRTRPEEARRIHNMARERSERRGTSVREEAGRLAEMAVRHERSDRAQREARRSRMDLRYLELERYLGAARRALGNAVAVDVELDGEQAELLDEALRTLRRLIELVDARFRGATDVDWNAELERLNEEMGR